MSVYVIGAENVHFCIRREDANGALQYQIQAQMDMEKTRYDLVSLSRIMNP